MNILTLTETMSAEELGKIILGERDAFVQKKTQKLLDALMESEIMEFFADAANATEGNFRNGYYSRTLNTDFGPLSLRIPRDRIGAFKTKIPAPYKRSTDNICEMIQRLYVRGMTEREIVDEISDDFGVTLSRETIRKSDKKTVANDFKDVYTSKDRSEAESKLAIFTFMDYPELLWRSIYTSNAIECFNSKPKKETRKRILMNSEENAILTITACCADYNKNAGKVTLRHFSDLTDEQKQTISLGN